MHLVRKLRAGKDALWYVYAWRGGPQVWTSEGEKPTITPEIFNAAAEARKQRANAPTNNLDSLIAAYRASPEFKDKLAPRTRRDYEIELDKISAKFGSVPLPVFDDRKMRGNIVAWRDEVAATPRTADKRMVMLATVLNYGVKTLGKLSINVAEGIPQLYSADRSEVIWTEADWLAITPHCSTELHQALRLASLTGMRLGDLIALEWAQVGTAAIVRVTNKKKRRVVVPILPELRALLDEIGTGTNGEGTVLKNSRRKPWTESGLGSVFQKAKVKAGIAARIHDLRGTYATWLANKGLTDQEIARIVGWSEKQVAELRTRYIDEGHVVSSLVERLAQKAIK